MDLSILTELIANFGVPIALVIAMAWFVFKIYKDTSASTAAREEKLYKEIEKNQEINEKALETLNCYAVRLGVIEKDIKEIKNDISHIANNYTIDGGKQND